MNRPLAVLLAGVLLLGCEADPYTLIKLGDAASAKPDVDLGPPCVKTNGGKEACDVKDNDCDGLVDEDFNFNTDVRHCGQCNNACLLSGAITVCELRQCKFKGCAPGFYDLDNDLALGWSSTSNGCEYACTPTGSELCDGKDNDCNGKTDETFTTDTDVQNCGKCGNACALANAVPKCVGGKCLIQVCQKGYIDKDKLNDNGCESPCTATGAEVCDGKDNDCNGVVDDPGGKVIDFTSDALNCGGCNFVCDISNAYSKCSSSKCTFNGCKSGYLDANNDVKDGCECLYAGLEVCDAVDNDCDGTIDQTSSAAPLTKACYSGATGTLNKGPCKGGTSTCYNGYWGTCVGEVTPKTEHCDGTDTDCDALADPAVCVYTGSGREQRIDDLSATTLGAANSTQLTIAGSGSLLVAAWTDRRNKQSDIYSNVSSDGGKTWANQDMAAATETLNNKLQPQIALGGGSGSSQRVYLAYQRFTDSPAPDQPGVRNIYLRASTNAGTSWGSPTAVLSSTTVDSLYVRLAVLPGLADKVVVCWEQISVKGSVNPNVYCSLSVNSGASFGAAVLVNNLANNAIVPQIALDDKYLYVVWQEGQNIMVDRSPITPNNLSFGSDLILSSGAGQDPTLLADGTGRVIVAWEDLRDKLTNIRVNSTANYGGTWLGADVRVDIDLVDGDSTRPVLAAQPGGRVHLAWEDTCRGKRDIYSSTSDDGGATWAKTMVRVPQSTAGSYASGRPSLAVSPTAGNKNVYLAWEDTRNGSYRDITFSVSLDGGKTWNIPDYRVNEAPAGKADAQLPLLFAGSSRVAVLWVDFRSKSGTTIGTGANGDIYASYLQ